MFRAAFSAHSWEHGACCQYFYSRPDTTQHKITTKNMPHLLLFQLTASPNPYLFLLITLCSNFYNNYKILWLMCVQRTVGKCKYILNLFIFTTSSISNIHNVSYEDIYWCAISRMHERIRSINRGCFVHRAHCRRDVLVGAHVLWFRCSSTDNG